MTKKSFSDMNCSIARALEIVGEHWTLLVLRELFQGAGKFDELQKRLSIASNILSARLETLTAFGVVKRVQYQAKPARYAYKLTEKGVELLPVLLTLMHWGDLWLSEGAKPPLLLKHKTCGQDTHAETVCAHCKKPLQYRQLVRKLNNGTGLGV